MRSHKGFSLIEIMVVVAIIGLLVTMAVPVYKGISEREAAKRALTDARLLQNALELYRDEVFDQSAYASASYADRYLLIIADSRWSTAPGSWLELYQKHDPYIILPPFNISSPVIVGKMGTGSANITEIRSVKDLPGY